MFILIFQNVTVPDTHHYKCDHYHKGEGLRAPFNAFASILRTPSHLLYQTYKEFALAAVNYCQTPTPQTKKGLPIGRPFYYRENLLGS